MSESLQSEATEVVRSWLADSELDWEQGGEHTFIVVLPG
ncbi:MAG: YbjN domain-containing protein, partial [Actinobacteria bacterium]|nr:YbjN domain-containing protein [Actinomycetota bacterium]